MKWVPKKNEKVETSNLTIKTKQNKSEELQAKMFPLFVGDKNFYSYDYYKYLVTRNLPNGTVTYPVFETHMGFVTLRTNKFFNSLEDAVKYLIG